MKVFVRVAGRTDFIELALPEGVEIRDVRVSVPGMRVDIEVPDAGHREGHVHTMVRSNELADPQNPPEVTFTTGAYDAEDMRWTWRSDAKLYAIHDRIIAKDMTPEKGKDGFHFPYKEVPIVKRGYRF